MTEQYVEFHGYFDMMQMYARYLKENGDETGN